MVGPLAESFLVRIIHAIPQMVWISDEKGAQLQANERWLHYTGLSAEGSTGNRWLEAVHPDDRRRAARAWREATRSAVDYETEYRLRGADGSYRWFLVRARRLRDGAAWWFGTCTDIDERKRAEQAQTFLAEVSRSLAGALRARPALANIARLCVPALGDWCQIDMLDRQDRVETIVFRHRDPERDRAGRQLAGRVRPVSRAEHGVRGALELGNVKLYARGSEWLAGRLASAAQLPEPYASAGSEAAMVVPLLGRGAPIGTITLMLTEDGGRYDDRILPVARELGRHVGLAIENLQLFEQQQRVADALQAASLPAALPDVLGLRFSAVYVPSSDEAKIGGDWYDAFRLPDGRVVVSIGDVSGSGLSAAVTMGTMRQAIRGIAQVHADPVLMLDAADRALRLESPHRMVTAFVGVVDPIAMTLTYASAGHPPALLRAPDGTVTELSDYGLPLGLRTRENAKSSVVPLPNGSLLVLYTDGLVEATRDVLSGMRAVKDVLNRCAGSNDPAQALFSAVLADGPRDDVAILTVDVDYGARRAAAAAATQLRRWTFCSDDPRAAQHARHEFAHFVGSRLGGTDEAQFAEIVFGELVSNVVRHAAGPVEVIADATGVDLVLHVVDEGPGFRHVPSLPDIFSESGRGLYMVAALTEEFHVALRATRGSHARAVLRVAAAPLR